MNLESLSLFLRFHAYLGGGAHRDPRYQEQEATRQGSCSGVWWLLTPVWHIRLIHAPRLLHNHWWGQSPTRPACARTQGLTGVLQESVQIPPNRHFSNCCREFGIRKFGALLLFHKLYLGKDLSDSLTYLRFSCKPSGCSLGVRTRNHPFRTSTDVSALFFPFEHFLPTSQPIDVSLAWGWTVQLILHFFLSLVYYLHFRSWTFLCVVAEKLQNRCTHDNVDR